MFSMTTASQTQSPDADAPRPDDFAGKIEQRIAPQRVRELSRIQPWRGVLHVLGEWLMIALAITVCERVSFTVWVYPLVVAFVGGRQHALFHLAHEATHYHLFKNRALNDLFADVFLAWPCLHSVPLYRKRHFGHHRHIGSLDDPHIEETYRKSPTEWRFPKTRRGLALWLLRRGSGLTFPAYLKGFLRGFPKASSPFLLLVKVAYYLLALFLIGWLGGFRVVCLYWLVPLATWTPMIRDLRLAAEHFAIDGKDDPLGSESRTVLPTLLERIFVCSKGTYFHSEHHDYPSVPFYHLPRLHREMCEQPQLAARLHLVRGYFRVLRQLSGSSDMPVSEAMRAPT